MASALTSALVNVLMQCCLYLVSTGVSIVQRHYIDCLSAEMVMLLVLCHLLLSSLQGYGSQSVVVCVAEYPGGERVDSGFYRVQMCSQERATSPIHTRVAKNGQCRRQTRIQQIVVARRILQHGRVGKYPTFSNSRGNENLHSVEARRKLHLPPPFVRWICPNKLAPVSPPSTGFLVLRTRDLRTGEWTR